MQVLWVERKLWQSTGQDPRAREGNRISKEEHGGSGREAQDNVPEDVYEGTRSSQVWACWSGKKKQILAFEETGGNLVFTI